MHAALSRQSLSCWHSPFWTIENLKRSFVIKTLKDKDLVIPRICFLKYFYSLTFVTSIERISFKSWRTRARCSVVLHRANSRWTTWFIYYTRVYAASISTCLTSSAFKIGRAANGFRLSWEIAKWDDKNGVVFLILDFRFKIYCFHIKWKRNVLISSQWTSPFPVKPETQVQLIVLKGRELWTVHSAFRAHGWITLQGSLQSPLKQASLLGHSLSSLHPGSGGGGTKF